MIHVPRGAPFSTVVDTLEARGLVDWATPFHLFGRLRGADTDIRAGSYVFPRDASWNRILGDLTEGRVQTLPVTIPEGLTLREIAPRLAPIAETTEDSALATLQDSELARALDVPGPTLEGYLFPDTYRFAPGVGVPFMATAMVVRYEAYWTAGRRARLDSLDWTERELVTLASVVQAEAARTEEMDTIASVYHNRLDRRMRLEADPTVLYALGGHRERLLYPAMDSVADNPYNTYTHRGLPPGPIGSPGEDALDATLWPAETDFLYFVAQPGTLGGGGHVFSRTLAEHNRAVAEYRRQRE
ncbi:MAG: endolytic transglycosylase MltG [Longimicrobiales bacterium]|nr:endolytic transglycosylase MltG [Longimicrobiales bacterium]